MLYMCVYVCEYRGSDEDRHAGYQETMIKNQLTMERHKNWDKLKFFMEKKQMKDKSGNIYI